MSRSCCSTTDAGSAVRAAGLLATLLAVAACGVGGGEPRPLDRSDRYGIFRDLVYYPPSDDVAHGFFLDTFESTQADWRSFAASRGEPGSITDAFVRNWAGADHLDATLPIVGVDLAEARTFARWRFGRLPSLDEWEFAVSAGGRYAYPWGNLPRAAYANTSELGYVSLSPVGMFESGRQRGRAYDLVGNAAEWTETLEVEWESAAFDLSWRVRVCRRHPALRGYRIRAVPIPTSELVAVDDESVPRRVTVGADYPMSGLRGFEPLALHPTERSSLVGIRVAADARTLVEALAAQREAPPETGETVLRAFLRRHRDALRPAWSAFDEPRDGPVAAILDEELGG